ncbi:MAG TPA: translation initiation factor IF-2 [bacterium]|nr:translation initiation factor IF-2 [bacterium]
MRISDLSKEIGKTNKEVIDFLKSKGSEYTSHFNMVNSDEEKLVRDHFSSGTKKTAGITATDDPSSKTVTTLIRKSGARQKSFIPHDQRESTENRPFFKNESEMETTAHSEDKHDAKESSEDPKPQTDTSEITVPEKHEDHDRKLSVEEEARRLAQLEHPEENQEHEQKDAAPKKDEKKKIEILDDIDEEEDLIDPKNKHKKKKVVIPETDVPVAAGITAPKFKSKKSIKNVDTGNVSQKVKGKIKGPDISQFIEDPYANQNEMRRRRREHKKRRPLPVAPANPTKAIKKILKLEDTIIVSELAKKIGVKASQLISKLMIMGELVGINDRINYDVAQLLAEEFGFTAENVALNEETYIEVTETAENNLKPRPPVVTVMGHVDHGKTKLLDAIRNTNIVDGEAGGITQHIGAYSVELEGNKITFLDTPGHEAFTAMRSRGAQATDVVILIVAADDGVMPQTIEAINHAKAAGVPIIVAINKIDKPEANPQKVRNELLKYEIVAEELGGEHLFVEISAKQRINIEGLLEAVLLQVEMMDLKADPAKQAEGIVIESKIDPGKGPVATMLVKDGTLKIGDLIVTGTSMGYVRSMMDWTGVRVKEAGPSMAVEITGLDFVPPAGEKLHVFKDEKKAKGLVDLRCQKLKEKKHEKESNVSLENLFTKMETGDVQDINIVVKADVDGSVEAILSSLKKIEHKKMNIRIIHSGVGGINENDVLLASASKGIVVGFNVRIDNKARQIASSEQVDIKIFSIIYELIDSIKSAMSGMLAPIIQEEFIGKLEVRDIFKVGKVGTIAGCMAVEGKIIKKSKVKVIRDNVVVFQGNLGTLKRFKDDVKEVKNGYECGVTVENYNDIKIGDIIECYIDKEIRDEVL